MGNEDDTSTNSNKNARTTSSSDSAWEKFKNLDTWIHILVVAAILIVIVLSVVGCYCCCRQPQQPVVMAPPPRVYTPRLSRRSSRVPQRVWPPPRRSSVRGESTYGTRV